VSPSSVPVLTVRDILVRSGSAPVVTLQSVSQDQRDSFVCSSVKSEESCQHDYLYTCMVHTVVLLQSLVGVFRHTQHVNKVEER
jgi:hypothetical protein